MFSVRTEPTRGDVRGNENWNSSASETLEDVVSLTLALVSVNCAEHNIFILTYYCINIKIIIKLTGMTINAVQA